MHPSNNDSNVSSSVFLLEPVADALEGVRQTTALVFSFIPQAYLNINVFPPNTAMHHIALVQGLNGLENVEKELPTTVFGVGVSGFGNIVDQLDCAYRSLRCHKGVLAVTVLSAANLRTVNLGQDILDISIHLNGGDCLYTTTRASNERKQGENASIHPSSHTKTQTAMPSAMPSSSKTYRIVRMRRQRWFQFGSNFNVRGILIEILCFLMNARGLIVTQPIVSDGLFGG